MKQMTLVCLIFIYAVVDQILIYSPMFLNINVCIREPYYNVHTNAQMENTNTNKTWYHYFDLHYLGMEMHMNLYT